MECLSKQRGAEEEVGTDDTHTVCLSHLASAQPASLARHFVFQSNLYNFLRLERRACPDRFIVLEALSPTHGASERDVSR